MPSIKIANQATNANALTGLKFVKLSRRSLITLFCAAVTVTDTVGFSVGEREVLVGANPNIEISADVVDTGRDLILSAEPGGRGDELFMPVVATTAVGLLVIIDEL